MSDQKSKQAENILLPRHPTLLRRPNSFKARCHEFWVHTVLQADDPPEKIALGAAVGVFVAFTPTMGVQMLIVFFLTWLLRANKAVSLPIVWISNPATVVPIYWFNYRVGRFLLGTEPPPRSWWRALWTPPEGMFASLQFYWDRFSEILWPLWLGSAIVGFVVSYFVYYATVFAIRAHRRNSPAQPTRMSHLR